MKPIKSSINLRIYSKDWNKLKRIFPAKKNETIAAYLERYIQAINEAVEK